jgi:hypothetical protein
MAEWRFQCDKDVCVKEAKAAFVRSKSDAKAQSNTSKAG